jgi:HlyD family secretion protein
MRGSWTANDLLVMSNRTRPEPLRAHSAPFRDTARQDRVLAAPSWWRRHGLVAAVLLICVLALAGLVMALLHASGAAGSIDRSRLTLATVQRGTFVRDVAAEGQVVAAVSPTLYASGPGTLTLQVHAGDPVAKGQVLALIDSPELSARLAQEEATLQSLHISWERARLDAERNERQLKAAYQHAQVDESTARRELDRSRRAYEAGAYTQLQVLRAEDALQKARFALEAAQESYEAMPKQNRFTIDSARTLFERQQFLVADLRRQVEALRVRSPVQGQIGQVLVADRANLTKDSPLMSVVDLSALEVEIKVPEYLARDLKPGMRAQMEGESRHLQGTVSAVSPEVVTGQVTARVRFVGGTPAGLRQSERLSVVILIDRRPGVLMVDRGPFIEQDGGGFAYSVHGNLAERHPVRLGAVSVSKVEVLGGLAAGDQIVVAGADAFKGAPRVLLSR